ncbi:hypothetical protein MUK70_11765 [Dyadobacter chenwenxiniae]|uniref:Uncharacterized protein n=1 Tax=Dyadobacter chenwenxiniae TaxID=2906456 RepID=A0A9X1PFT9_9BACT|nr:hypothetical protein [Dyadobacter chenwenxiniae]MCF0059918.1 hypothetical protein [Dyadobacter chenwenxiniae]UON85657.1 hypothetical protein MUK70_11765 [Dyadobacter chenwenxiniae]
MAFDKKHYRAIKKFMDQQILHVDFRLVDEYRDKPVEWAETFLFHISHCIEEEDYEGAKAVTDSIKEFLDKYTDVKVEDLLLKVPEYKRLEIVGIICYGKDDDKSGLASGGAEFISF